MARTVVVSAPAHLHAGNIDLHGGLGRLYGTLGFTISLPRLVVEAWECSGTRVEPPEGLLAEYAYLYARSLLKAYGLPGVCLKLASEIPAMVGLGSRTPLALSIAVALREIYKVPIPLEEAAILAGRSTISGLGFYAFTRGGMLLDAGFREENKGREIPPLVYRRELPEEWRFVVAVPKAPQREILALKKREEEVLDSMPRMDSSTASLLARIVLMKILPAAEQKNLEELLEGLHLFNKKLGEYWASRQRGVYCCKLVEEGLEILEEEGYPGLQSSWGPAFYTIAPDYMEAYRLKRVLEKWIRERGGGEIYVSKPDNRGALIYA